VSLSYHIIQFFFLFFENKRLNLTSLIHHVTIPNVKSLIYFITKKPIDTNRNIEGIFLSVNFREILSTEIFPRYIPRKLR